MATSALVGAVVASAQEYDPPVTTLVQNTCPAPFLDRLVYRYRVDIVNVDANGETASTDNRGASGIEGTRHESTVGHMAPEHEIMLRLALQ